MINTRIFKDLLSNLRAGKSFEPQTRSASPSGSVSRLRPPKRALHYARECEQRSQSANKGIRSQEPGEGCSQLLGSFRWPSGQYTVGTRVGEASPLCFFDRRIVSLCPTFKKQSGTLRLLNPSGRRTSSETGFLRQALFALPEAFRPNRVSHSSSQ
jgi:hypothetical protein